MTFEIGKKYKHGLDTKNVYECVYVRNSGAVLVWGESGCYIDNVNTHYYQEYKEPVVHKYDLIWYKLQDKICTRMVGHGWGHDSKTIYGYPILKRETVSYTEEDHGG